MEKKTIWLVQAHATYEAYLEKLQKACDKMPY